MFSKSMVDPNFSSQAEEPSAEHQCAEEGVVVEECSAAVLISSFGESLRHFTLALSLIDMQQFSSLVCTLHIPDYNVHALVSDQSRRSSTHLLAYPHIYTWGVV